MLLWTVKESAMRKFTVVLVIGVLVIGLVALVGCGGGKDEEAVVDTSTQEGSDTPRGAIESYCNEKGIDIPDLTVSREKQVSVQDPTWEIDYAFPAEAEGTGQFFLLHNAVEGWVVVAHTTSGQTGWTAEQLGALGAPADLATE